jgi:glycosyltransferase involved in cell wall biosynthesis
MDQSISLIDQVTESVAEDPAISGSGVPGENMNVMIVMPLAEQRGGGELMFLQLIEFGREQGINWSVAFFSDGPMVQQVRDWGVPAFILNAGRLRHPHRMAAAIWKLNKLFRQNNINAVLSFMGKAQLYGGTAAMLSRIPSLWYQLGMPAPPSWQDRLASALPSRLIFTCSNAASTAQAAVWPHRPVKTVYPGVQLDRFDPAKLPTPQQCRQKLGLPIDGPLIGIVGRLQRWKGMQHLIDAMPTILKTHPDAHAVIVGGSHAFEPDYPDQLNSQIKQLGLTDHVILAGLQSNVPEWMQAMDVIVHASDNEPFGIVVIEAMALGKPVVAAASGGPTEIITDEVDGLLWDTARPANLAECVIRFQADSHLVGSVATRARHRASDFAVQGFANDIGTAVQRFACDKIRLKSS